MARVKYYDHQSEQWKYADTAFGAKGDPGKTPEKGVDYFTEEDKQEMIGRLIDEGVLTYNEQELTEEQKAQARENIGIDQVSFDKLTEDLDADGFRITNLPLPQSGSEPATKEFVENFTIESSTYVATDDGEGNVTIRPYLADEDELVFKSHIQNQNNPHNVTAAQVGARPNNWTPTASEVGARPDNWTPTAEEVGAATPEVVNSAKTAAVNEAKTYTNEQVKKAPPPNLLVNSYFRNLVNQRGKDTYTGYAYSIDRWVTNAASKITVKENCINISWVTGTYPQVRQPIRDGVITPNEKYTVAARLIDGTLAVKSGALSPDMNPYSVAAYVNDTTGNKFSVRVAYDTEYKYYYVVFSTSDNYTAGHDVEWIALYPGEYTKETLPEYRPMGYTAELMECQRYYLPLNTSCLGAGYATKGTGNGYFLSPIPVLMQRKPEFKWSGTNSPKIRAISGMHSADFSTFAVYDMSGNGVCIKFSSGDAETGPVALFADGAIVWLDAEVKIN